MSKRQAVLMMFCFTGIGSAGACATGNQVSPSGAAAKASPAETEPVRIIYDTDMSLDVDDVGALALLHALADHGEAELLGVMISESMRSYDGLWGPPMVDIVNTYYGRPNIPVGIYKGTATEIGRYGKFAEKVVNAGFPHDLKEAELSEDATRLYRKLLAASPPRSVAIVSSGYLTNLYGLLLSMLDDISPMTGLELVVRTVSEWTCSGGRYPSSGTAPEINFARYPDTTQYVLSNWPGKVTFTGDELAAQFPTGGKLTNTFELSANPVAMAWHHFNGGQPQASRDSIAVLYAVRGLDEGSTHYFRKGGNGANHFEKLEGFNRSGRLSQAQNTWQSDASGPQSFLKVAAATMPVTSTIDDLITAPPSKAAPVSASRQSR